MKPIVDIERRILDFLEGELTEEQEAQLLAEAADNPEVQRILDEFQRQDQLLSSYFEQERPSNLQVARPVLPPREVGQRRYPVGAVAAAAVVLLTVGGYGAFRYVDSYPQLTIESINGAPGVQALSAQGTRSLAAGTVLPRREAFRLKAPAKSTAVLVSNGTTIELNQRTTLAWSSGFRSSKATLERGEIVVQGDAIELASTQGAIRSEGGTFRLVRGLGGEELAVLQGEVTVGEKRLRAGEMLRDGVLQTASASGLEWSKFASLGHAAATSSTHSSEPHPLAHLLPESTNTFVQVRNLPEVFASLQLGDMGALGKLTEHPILAETPTLVTTVEAAVRLAQTPEWSTFAESLRGHGIVAAHEGGLLVIGEITKDLEGAESFLRQHVQPALAALESPRPIRAGIQGNQLVLSVGDLDPLAVAPTEFAQSEFYRRSIAEAGPSLILTAIDPQRLMDLTATRTPFLRPLFSTLGLENALTILAGDGFTDEARNRALSIQFDGPLSGALGWLAEPGPFGSADLFGAEASLYLAAQVDSPVAMVKEAFATQVGDATSPRLHGLLSTLDRLDGMLGSEVAVAMDSFPNVQLAFEVRESGSVLGTLYTALQEAEPVVGESMDVVLREDQSGRGYVSFVPPAIGVQISATLVGDYLVFAAGEQYLQETIGRYGAESTLQNAPRFASALPSKGGGFASMVLYHDPANGGGEFGLLMQSVGLDADTVSKSPSPAGTTAQFFYAVAGDDRIDFYQEGVRSGADVLRSLGPRLGGLIAGL